MRALVTGGAGFIGSALAERLLAAGAEVDVIDDLSTGSLARLAGARSYGRALRFHQIDVCDEQVLALLERRRPEIVFHLGMLTGAARALADPARDAEVSVVGSLRILEAARRYGARKVVVAATAELAAAPPLAVSAHGLSEQAVLGYLRFYRDHYGLEFTVLALGCVYGPAEADPGPVGRIAAALKTGRPCRLRTSDAYDLVYLDDAVDALVRAGERGSGLVVPIGTGRATPASALAEQMAAIACTEVVVEAVGTDQPGRHALDPSRAELHLGWRPFTGLATGLAAALGEAVSR